MAAFTAFAAPLMPDGGTHSVEIPMSGYRNLKIHIDNPSGQGAPYQVVVKGHPEAMFWAPLVDNGMVAADKAAIVEVQSHYPLVKLMVMGPAVGVLVWVHLSGIMEN